MSNHVLSYGFDYTKLIYVIIQLINIMSGLNKKLGGALWQAGRQAEKRSDSEGRKLGGAMRAHEEKVGIF